MDEFEIIIIGGGIAGLSAGLHLAERGFKPLILEADPDFAGGRISGKPAAKIHNSDGREWTFPAEHGIHGFWRQYVNLKGMLSRHNLTPSFVRADRQEWVHGEKGRVRRTEMGRVVRRTFWPAPFHYGALFFRPSFLAMLGWRDWLAIPQVLSSLLVAVSIDPMVEGRNLENKTLADFCRGWSPSMKAFVATLARSGLSARPENVPLAGFIAFLRFYTVLRRDSQGFDFLTSDPETALISPMVRRLKELGGNIKPGCKVTHLEKTSGENWLVFFQSEGKPTQNPPIQTRYLILATDAAGASRILLDSPPTREVAQKFKWPEGLETAIIRLWFSAKPGGKAEAGLVSGDFIVDNFFWLNRFQDLFRDWEKATGGQVVESHIYGPPEVLAQPDHLLLARAISDLETIFPAVKGKLLHSTFQRNTPSHTLFYLGSIREHLGVRTPWPGLFCCGDWVRHPTGALFLERATVTGIEAANTVLAAEGKALFKLLPHSKPEILARLSQVILRSLAGSIRGTNLARRKKE